MELKEMHERETEALCVFRDICDAHNIEYYLIAGSTLGAVRHRGFIPWDDDIDVGVKYERIRELEEILLKELPEPYTYISYRTNSRYPLLNPKILYQGICFIDIYPLVRISDNDKEVEIQWKVKKELEKIYNHKINYELDLQTPSERKINALKASLQTREQLQKKLEDNCDRYTNQETSRYINLFSVYSCEKEQILARWQDQAEIVEFEGLRVRSVGCTDEYLTHLYGNYMELPPEEERIPKHEAEYFGDLL